MNKKEYREKSKIIRAGLDIDKISVLIVKQIRNTSVYINSNNVMLYYPKNGELNLLSLSSDNKNFYLPRIVGEDIVPCSWCDSDELVLSKYNTFEPQRESAACECIDLIILPGLCADKNKNRLGYGKGCYDRFLEKCAAATIFAVPQKLLFDSIPAEFHDKKADIIITENAVIL